LFRKPANARTLTPWILMPRSMSGIPSALAVDTHGYVYLTGDFGPRFIQKISPAGVLLTRFRLSGQTAGRVARVAVDRAFGSIAIDRKGNIYAPDAANNGIRKLSPQGKQLAVWGTAGSEPGQFH